MNTLLAVLALLFGAVNAALTFRSVEVLPRLALRLRLVLVWIAVAPLTWWVCWLVEIPTTWALATALLVQVMALLVTRLTPALLCAGVWVESARRGPRLDEAIRSQGAFLVGLCAWAIAVALLVPLPYWAGGPAG